MRGYGKRVREVLDAGGARFLRRVKGDHDIWRGANGEPVIVPVHIDSRHTANGILMSAGLPKAF